MVEELELVDVASQRVLGVATLLSDGKVLVDTATFPYAVVAEVRRVDVWKHLKGVGNGYVLVRSTTGAPT